MNNFAELQLLSMMEFYFYFSTLIFDSLSDFTIDDFFVSKEAV